MWIPIRSAKGPIHTSSLVFLLWLAVALQGLFNACFKRFLKWRCQGLNQRYFACKACALLLTKLGLPFHKHKTSFIDSSGNIPAHLVTGDPEAINHLGELQRCINTNMHFFKKIALQNSLDLQFSGRKGEWQGQRWWLCVLFMVFFIRLGKKKLHLSYFINEISHFCEWVVPVVQGELKTKLSISLESQFKPEVPDSRWFHNSIPFHCGLWLCCTSLSYCLLGISVTCLG